MIGHDRAAWSAVALALGVTAAGGCGEFWDPVELDVDRRYSGALEPLNGSGVTGSVEFIVDEDDDEFMAAADAAGLSPHQTHPQHIHASPTCPTREEDANGDGFVDAVEAMTAAGLILLPLDFDLSEIAADSFPTASATGRVNYEVDVSLQRLLAGLHGPDPDPGDGSTMLDGEPLALEARTYVIHGVAPETELPPSIATMAGLPPHQTLPVACAEIEAAD